MTAPVQLDLLGSSREVCALIAGDPAHERDRAAVVDAAREASRQTGLCNANTIREHLPPWVYHRVIGATVNALISRGVLVPTGVWARNSDRRGGNGGKPCMTYRWNEAAL